MRKEKVEAFVEHVVKYYGIIDDTQLLPEFDYSVLEIRVTPTDLIDLIRITERIRYTGLVVGFLTFESDSGRRYGWPPNRELSESMKDDGDLTWEYSLFRVYCDSDEKRQSIMSDAVVRFSDDNIMIHDRDY